MQTTTQQLVDGISDWMRCESPSSDPAAVLEAAHGWCLRLGCTMRLSEFGVPESDLPRMAEEAHAIRRLLDNNPRDLGREDILAIYRAAA